MESIFINTLEKLKPFLNDKGFFEIVTRNKKKKFQSFFKAYIGDEPKVEQSGILEKAIGFLNPKDINLKNTVNVLKSAINIQQLSVILNGVNLCATCVGFAIMYAKLDKLSGQISQLMSIVKQGTEVQTDFEYKKVLSEYSNMLDSRKRQKYYTEDQLRKLVDDEYNVMNMLIDVFTRELTEDSDNLIFSIFSLASMLAVTLRYFDELYYFNNREVLADGEKWHSSHENWMSVFTKITSDEFMKKLQDHGLIDLGYSTIEADIYYTSLSDQVKSLVQDIRDNQTIIETLDSKELTNDFYEYNNAEVAAEIESSFSQVNEIKDDPDAVDYYRSAMKQVGLAS